MGGGGVIESLHDDSTIPTTAKISAIDIYLFSFFILKSKFHKFYIFNDFGVTLSVHFL